MIPSINTWFTLEEKQPDKGDIVIACVNNARFEIEKVPKFSVIAIMYGPKEFVPLIDFQLICEKTAKDKRTTEDIIVWQPMPNPPHELRERDATNKKKCYCHGKFFDTHQEMIEHSIKWIDLPFDYDEFCNQIRLMMGAVLLNYEIRMDKYTNRDAYELARLQLGWGSSNAEKQGN